MSKFSTIIEQYSITEILVIDDSFNINSIKGLVQIIQEIDDSDLLSSIYSFCFPDSEDDFVTDKKGNIKVKLQEEYQEGNEVLITSIRKILGMQDEFIYLKEYLKKHNVDFRPIPSISWKKELTNLLQQPIDNEGSKKIILFDLNLGEGYQEAGIELLREFCEATEDSDHYMCGILTNDTTINDEFEKWEHLLEKIHQSGSTFRITQFMVLAKARITEKLEEDLPDFLDGILNLIANNSVDKLDTTGNLNQFGRFKVSQSGRMKVSRPKEEQKIGSSVG